MTFPGDPRAPADVRREQEEAAARQAEQDADGLSDKTKDELLEEAERRGVEVRTSATKAEILAAVRAAPPAEAQAEAAPDVEAE
jgi:hypothetical protein